MRHGLQSQSLGYLPVTKRALAVFAEAASSMARLSGPLRTLRSTTSVRRCRPLGSVLEVPGCGHFLHLEKPAEMTGVSLLESVAV